MFQIHQIPIRDWNLVQHITHKDHMQFQIHQIPIRDWNEWTSIPKPKGKNLFQIHQIPIRDWNKMRDYLISVAIKFQIHQIPIRDWNRRIASSCLFSFRFQIHQIPIRDWNTEDDEETFKDWLCFKFTKSLLGIETMHFNRRFGYRKRFKFTKSLLGIETTQLSRKIQKNDDVSNSPNPY